MPKCKSARGNRSYGRLSTSIPLRLCILFAVALQIEAGATVAVARAEEESEPLYPGRYVAVCKPAPIVGCVCETDVPGQMVPFPQLASQAGDHVDQLSQDAEYWRMIEWLRRVCGSGGGNAGR
jgi:hypothetical protein